MARGKNNRRRSNGGSVHPTMAVQNQQPNVSAGYGPTTTCKTCVANGSHRCSGQCLLNPARFGHNNANDVEKAVDYHWKILPVSIRHFVLADPNSLCLKKFVNFYSMPEHVDNTSRNVAASICGCSWYLALHYIFLGKMPEAKGLILNAAFLQEVYNNKPISEIASLCSATNEHGITLDNLKFKKSLPFFYDGLYACSTKENMSAFLRTKLTPTFVAQTSQAKKQAQNYVDYISSSWGEQGNEKATTSISEEIEIVLVDSDSHEKTTLKIGSASTLKALFNQYAEGRGVSLRSLRFSYEDKTLFLSSIGQKTPNDLGIKNLDMIIVTEQKQASPVPTNDNKTKANRRGSNSAGSAGMGRRKTVDDGKPRKNRRASWTGCLIDTSSEEFLKLKHSRKLTRLFEEAEPIFNKIRQELNDLSIQRSKPKRRITTSRPATVIAEPICNPVSEGLGGKAGKVFFNVNVGQVENLYKTSKTGVSSHRFKLSVDLHGYTKEEAVTKLDDCLPEWKDTAMRGEYPWVIPVEIVCGGGSQILSETVERWIKENDGVANAPKINLNRRRITLA